MVIDKERLKALAEAAHNDSGDYAALNDYGMAVPPAVVLALLAEIEALREGATFRAVQSLRADCEALRKDSERYQWLIRRISKSQYYFLGAQLTSNTLEGVGAAVDAAMAKEVQP